MFYQYSFALVGSEIWNVLSVQDGTVSDLDGTLIVKVELHKLINFVSLNVVSLKKGKSKYRLHNT